MAPAAQQPIFVAWLGTEVVQTLAEMGDAQRRRRSGNQSGFGNDCGEVVRILTQALAYYSVTTKRKSGSPGFHEKYFD
ncbi:MAG: hypothetical protein PXX77_04680, partial [Gallionella sp.]|nr:hypothetical protein [Gallionella sp.]